jgi:hypothetical protein
MRVPTLHAARRHVPRAAALPFFQDPIIHKNHAPIASGKYLISPMTRCMDNGWYACSVSIRSGTGRGTTDRVLRLTRLFRDSIAACEYAIAEGLQWIAAPAGRLVPLAA